MRQHGGPGNGTRTRSVHLRAAALLGAVVTLAAIVLAPAASAQAADKPDYTIRPVGATAVTVQYGQPWSFGYRGNDAYYSCAHIVNCDPWFNVTLAGQTTPYASHVYYYEVDHGFTFGNGTGGHSPLAVGKYVFSATQHYTNSLYGSSTASVTLTVVPATMTSSVDIQTDSSHASHAILSVQGSGKFVDAVANYGDASDYPPAPRMPAGTWKFTVTDSDGKTAYTDDVATAAGDPPLASAYWTDAPPGKTFSATATFVPDPASAHNFVVAPAPPVSYTSAAAPTGESPAPVTPPAKPASLPEAGTQVPVWAVGLWSILILGLIIALLILVLRLTRSIDHSTVASKGQDDVVV